MKPLYTLKRDPSPNSKSLIYDFIDLDITQSYTPLGTNKQKTQAANKKYFGCGKKGYI